MNHEHDSIEADTPPTAAPAREPYVTPRLTNYGRFQQITSQSGGPNSVADDEGVFDGGTID